VRKLERPTRGKSEPCKRLARREVDGAQGKRHGKPEENDLTKPLFQLVSPLHWRGRSAAEAFFNSTARR